MSSRSSSGLLLALFLAAATIALIVIGTLRPNQSGSGVADANARLMGAASSAQDAVNELLAHIARRQWADAYSSLANKSEFSESDFTRDLTGNYGSLRTYASLDSFDVQPVRASSDEAQMRAVLHWTSVVGDFED